MTRGHLETIQMIFPEVSEKTFLVCEFDDELRRRSLDVSDPIGLGIHAYFECRDMLKKAMPSLLKFIDSQPDMTPAPQPATPTAATNRPLRIALGADHGGVELKQAIHQHSVPEGVSSFPTLAHTRTSRWITRISPNRSAGIVIASEADFGVLVCKSGIGMSIAANRYPHIRASLVDNPGKTPGRIFRQAQ